ncbi:AsmA family protein [Nisaea denitrificans]|uniref:AsmA family protein n=1 Tax=Nisaea denitrificans TaxID=390877 RepID=UPI0004174A72|nr:AsmA family protein [Nisaea denitrificans]
MKKLVLTVLALIVVLGVVVLVGPSFVDWNSYKAEITRTVEEQTGRRLEIDGDISFQVLPAPRLSVEKLKLANVEGGSADTFVSAGALQIHVALAPLLSGKVKVASVTLKDPVVALEQFPDGRNNWTFSTPASKPEETAGSAGNTSADGGGDIDFSLDGATIANGRISFFDHATGETHSVADLDVALSASSLNGPFKLTGDFTYKDVPITLSAATGTIDAGHATPLETIVTLGNKAAELSYSGTLVLGDMPRLMGTISATGKDLISAGAALAPLGTGTDALPAALAGPFKLSAKLEASAERAVLDELALSAGGLSAKGVVTALLAGGIDVDARLALERFVLDDVLAALDSGKEAGGATPAATPAPTNTATANFALPSGINADLVLTADAVDYRGGVIRQPRLEASLAHGAAVLKVFSAQMPGGSDLSLSGTLKSASGSPQFTGRADFVSDNLRGTLGWLDIEIDSIAADRLRKGSLGANITASPEQIQLTDWTMDLDNTRVRGGLTLLLRERPAFGLALDLGKINLDAYLPPEDQAGKTTPVASGKPASSGPSPMEQAAVALNSFDANIRIGFDEITVRKTPIIGGQLEARIQNGALSVSKLAIADLGGAKVTLSGSLAGAVSDPNTKLEFQIDAKSVTRLARLAGIEPSETLQRIGAATLNGSILGDLSALTIDATAKAAGATASVKGILHPLAQPLNVDLALKLQHPSVDKLAETLSPGAIPKDITLGSLALAATVMSAPDGAYGVDATMDLGGGQLGLKGTIAPGPDQTALALDTRYAHPDVVALIRGFSPGYAPTKRDLGPATLVSRLEGNTDTLKINGLRLGLGPISLTGDASLALTGPRPKLTFAAESGTIAIDPWLPKGSAAPAGGVAPVVPVKSSSRTWSRESIDTSGLLAADANISLKAEKVLYGAYMLDKVDLAAALENGALTVSRLSSGLFGGTLNGTASLKHGATPSAGLTLAVKNADVKQAAASAATGAPQVTGTLDYETSLNTTGRSEYALVSGLQGSGAVKVIDGSVEGFDLPAVSEQLKQLDRSVDFLVLAQRAMQGGTTPFESLTASYKITNGVLQSEDISLKSKAAEGRGTAVVNLPPQEMDVRTQFWLSEHPNSPPIGLRLTGPLDNPRQILDANKLQSFVLQRVIERGILRQFNKSPDSSSDGTTTTTPDSAPSQPVEKIDPQKALRGVLKGLLGN